MKRSYIVMGVAVLVILGIFFFARSSVRVEKEKDVFGGEIVIPTIQVQSYTVKESVLDNEAVFVKDFQLPRVINHPNSSSEEKVNEALVEVSDEAVAVFQTEIKDVPSGALLRGENSLTIRHEVLYVTEDLLSIEFIFSSYTMASVHPFTYASTFNYDFGENKKLGLFDFFAEDSDYLRVLSVISRGKLSSLLEDDFFELKDWVETGTAPREDLFQNVGVSEEGIKVFFIPYQVAPYALGIQEITIPFQELKTIIRPQGFLTSFL